MSSTGLTLAFRPRGSAAWVDVDLGSPGGRRLAALFGFTIPKEYEMSAQPIEQIERDLDHIEASLDTAERHLKVVENNVEKAGLLLAAQAKGRQAYGYIRKSPRVAWDWIRETFHLDPAMEFVGSVLTWLRNQLSILAAHFGTGGGAGLGLLAMSTTAGRTLLSYAMKPVMWALTKVANTWVRIENALYIEPEEGKTLGAIARARNWIADRMAGIREFFTGNGTSPGVIARGAMWFFKNVAPHLEIGSTTMVAARAGGFALAGPKMVTALAMIPMSATALAVSQWVFGGLIAAAFVANVVELARRGWAFLAGKTVTVTLEDEQGKTVAEKVTTIPSAVAVAVAPDGTAAKATPATVAKAAANGNRATRRAAKVSQARTTSAGK